MASGPAPPDISVSSSPAHARSVPATHADARLSSAASRAPPSILLEPTVDGVHDNGGNDDNDDPFRFEVDDSFSGPRNPHAEALLRRSPSPVPDPSPPPPPRGLSPSGVPGSSSSSSSLLRPETHLSLPGRSSPTFSGFLRPPGATMEDQSAPSVSSTDGGDGSNGSSVGGSGNGGDNPFNFQTQYMSTSPVRSGANIGLRRGHRYKHSSVSAQHQIFQEPPARAPPVLPASLPLPTLREAWTSMRKDQRARLYWCLCHAAVAAFVFLCATEGGDSLALTALSHLVFFDVGSAAVCVAVDVLGNFEVWRRSTIRHPFGLRRAEVLAGFAMSIFLVFGGFDLLSHDLKDVLEAATLLPMGAAEAAELAAEAAAAASLSSLGVAGHDHAAPHMDIGSHRGHHHTRYINPGSVDVAALAAFASTLISAYGLGNHARIRRALMLSGGGSNNSSGRKGTTRSRSDGVVAASVHGAASQAAALVAGVVGLASVLANPFHFLTLAVSLVLLVLPLLFVAVQTWLDRVLCATIALSMLLLGARLAVAQGLMLLMSFPGKEGGASSVASLSSLSSLSAAPRDAKGTVTVASVLEEIAAEPHVSRVEDAQFWQVHYGLCMANLKVRVAGDGGDDEDAMLRQLRSRIARVVQNRLGEGYGRGNSLRWEVTVQTSIDR